MELRRVVIRDKQPVFDSAILARPLNRAVLTAAAVSLGIQIVAIAGNARGLGRNVSPFERVSFALVALLWLAIGLLVFLQRRHRRTGQLFLLASASGGVFMA